MTDSELEVNMDAYVINNMSISRWVNYFDVIDNRWRYTSGALAHNTKYKLLIRARNVGSETYVRNVGIRAVNIHPTRITFFDDDSYENEVSRVHSPI